MTEQSHAVKDDNVILAGKKIAMACSDLTLGDVVEAIAIAVSFITLSLPDDVKESFLSGGIDALAQMTRQIAQEVPKIHKENEGKDNG